MASFQRLKGSVNVSGGYERKSAATSLSGFENLMFSICITSFLITFAKVS